MIKSKALSVPGEEHTVTGADNEDIILAFESEIYCCYGIADGQSRKKHCIAGARASLSAAAQFFDGRCIEQIRISRFCDETQYELIKAIRAELEKKAAELNSDIGEFGSTLIFLALEPETGAYVLTHLGDGRVLGISNNGEVKNLSSPENGLCLSQTWLTTSPNAVSHLRIYLGNVCRYRRIIMLSDGADRVFLKERLTSAGTRALAEGDSGSLLEYFTVQHCSDDSSCIIVDNLPESSKT